eukprot:TRINITY_DN12801_c0_g1_i1.p1 TRINITY_DN12801_c0_g1~~TRINITY_DN12801_c0_g1_i1.p1  ORF type:complete len:714 (+),score=180.38 TRINITY_DN12801_c0_g1_i1:51-2144(+)
MAHASLYSDLAAIPYGAGGFFSAQGSVITLGHAQRDIERNETRSFSTRHFRMGDKYVEMGFPVDTVNVRLQAISPSGKLLCVVRQLEGGGRDHAHLTSVKDFEKEKNKFLIEVWDSSRLVHSFPTDGKHGGIYSDGWFESLVWSPNEDAVAYIAETSVPKTSTYFASFPAADAPAPGSAYEFVDDWGEAYIGRVRPAIVLCSFVKRTITVLSDVPEDISPGQVQFVSQDSMVFVGWKTQPFKIGVKYCYNRECGLYEIKTTGADLKLISAADDSAVRCPRVLGDRVIYLATPRVHTHNTTNRMRSYNLATAERKTLIDIVEVPTAEGEFPGLYVDDFPKRPFLNDGRTMLMQTQWGLDYVVLAVDADTGKWRRVKPQHNVGYMSVMDISGSLVLLNTSSPTQPERVYVADFATSEDAWELVYAPSAPAKAQSALEALEWSYLRLGGACEAVLLKPRGVSNLPLVVVPHGGPHSGWVASYFMSTAYLAALGRAVLLTNYVGSTGYGQKCINDLTGHVGVRDVADVMALGEAAAQHHGCDGPMSVCGGSHGGFLTAHLIAQFPDRFKAAILRNPVTNLFAMKAGTDIPDWCDVETTGEAFTTTTSEVQLQALYKASPVALVDRVKTPCLMMIGAKDRRVPPFQAMEYYRALKAQNVPCRMLIYPDCPHAIASAGSEADAWVNGALWLDQHSGASKPVTQ